MTTEKSKSKSTPRKRRNGSGGVYLRGRTYWIHYRIDGVRVMESAETGDKRAALARLAEVQRTIAAGTYVPTSDRVAPTILTVRAYLSAWSAPRRKRGIAKVDHEATWFDRFVLPKIGDLPLVDVRRSHILAIMESVQSAKIVQTGKPYAARSILGIYAAITTAFSDAVRDELIPASPCTLSARRGELPICKDASPTFRRDAVYTREEAEALISDTRIPEDRRVYYALGFFVGLRSGEINGRRWRDITDAEPLARMLVATQSNSRKGESETKTGDDREVPVHPTLAAILDDWKREGFAKVFGRMPQPNDYIVPSRHDDRCARSDKMLARMQKDLLAIGVTRHVPHARHAMRATFLTLLETDGAIMAIARRATHRAPKTVAGGYARYGWSDLSREIGKLRIGVAPLPPVIDLASAREKRDGAGYVAGYTTPETPAKSAASGGVRVHAPRKDPSGSSRSYRSEGGRGTLTNTAEAIQPMQTVTHVTDPLASLVALYATTKHRAARSAIARAIVALGGVVPS